MQERQQVEAPGDTILLYVDKKDAEFGQLVEYPGLNLSEVCCFLF